MQFQNSNEHMPYRKRKCVSYRPNDVLDPFQEAFNLIVSNHERNAQNMLVSGLAILVGKIRQMQNYSDIPSSPIKINKNTQNSSNLLNKEMFTYKKQIPFFNQDSQEEETNPEQQIKEIVILEKTGKKMDKSKKKVEFCIPQKDMKNQMSKTKKHEKLIKSLNKLSMSDQYFQLQKELQNFPNNANHTQEREQTDLMKFDEDVLKNKSITQLLQASSKKVKQNQMKKPIVIEDSDSEYEMTDHQSNQSDSDGDKYEEKSVYEKEAGHLFGNLFAGIGKHQMTGKNFFNQNLMSNPTANVFSGQLNPPKLNFASLMNSPKKSKSKKKRIYINKKKVPHWAQNLQEVQRTFNSIEQNNLRDNSKKIFGICTIQNLQTNTIFNLKDQYTRASTARWQRKKSGFVI